MTKPESDSGSSEGKARGKVRAAEEVALEQLSDAEGTARGKISDAEGTARGKVGKEAGVARGVLGEAAEVASADLLASAGGLAKALGKLTETLADLKSDVRRRSIFAAIIISFDILLTAGLGIGIGTAVSASNRANTNLVIQEAACQTGNEANKTNHDLWTYALSQTSSNPTPAQRAAVAAFQARVDKAYAQRDCGTVK